MAPYPGSDARRRRRDVPPVIASSLPGGTGEGSRTDEHVAVRVLQALDLGQEWNRTLRGYGCGCWRRMGGVYACRELAQGSDPVAPHARQEFLPMLQYGCARRRSDRRPRGSDRGFGTGPGAAARRSRRAGFGRNADRTGPDATKGQLPPAQRLRRTASSVGRRTSLGRPDRTPLPLDVAATNLGGNYLAVSSKPGSTHSGRIFVA